jgi:uncharacterized protein (TIGR00369 family)
MQTLNPEYRAFIEAGFDYAPFVSSNAIRLEDCGPGWCASSLVLETRHTQQNGVAHGGLLATIADHTAGGAAATLLAPGSYALTAELKVSMLRAARGEKLECRAQVIKPGRALSFVEAEVYAIEGERRELVAKASATMAVIAGK